MVNAVSASRRGGLMLLGLVVLILAHFVALIFRIQPTVSLWFPPSGVAIVLTFWLGAPGIALTALASIWTEPFWGNSGWERLLGLTDVVEPLIAWLLYQQMSKGSLSLRSLKDAVAFTVSAPLLSCSASAVVGNLALAAVGKMSAVSLPLSISHWWLGNALGTMAIAPAALLMLTPWLQQHGWLPQPEEVESHKPQLHPDARAQVEVAVIMGLCICTAALTVSQATWGNFTFQQFSFLSFVPILWAAVRFGVEGGVLTSSFCVLITLVAYLLAYPNAPTLSSFPVQTEVLHIHKLSLLVQCGVGLLVGTTMTERTVTQVALAVERVKATEYQARAQLSEQLLKLNDSLTQANLRLEQSNQEKDSLLQREQAAHHQLLESEARFRTALEAMVDGVSILSTVRDAAGKIVDFRIEYVNAAACHSNRMTREAQLGQHLCELFPVHCETNLFADYCRVVETGEPLVKESLTYEDQLGQQQLSRAYDIRAAKLGDGFIALWREVTDRYQAEAALRLSEARFTQLTENVPGVIYQYRLLPDGRDEFTYISAGIHDLYELEPQAVLADATLMWQLIHPDDRDAFQRSFSITAPSGQQWRWEWRAVLPSGKLKWTQGIARSERQPDGSILWDGFLLDITERKQIEVVRAQLLAREQEVRRQAEAANRMKDEFLAIVSHELRSPLNAILGWARLLRTRNLDAEKVAQALEVIERNAKAQTQLIEDLLDISRIIRGKVRLAPQPISLISVINAALDTVRPTAEAKRIQLQFAPGAQSGEEKHTSSFCVSGDLDRLQQVVWNLLSNAIKFTPEGGQVRVKLSSQVGDSNKGDTALSTYSSYAEIQVIDTGKGISPDFLPYVFERFRQADSSTTRVQGGLGLGLAIVRNLVELHGGTVQVTSSGEGQGATFTVRLPLLPDQSSTSAEPATGAATNSDQTSPPFESLRSDFLAAPEFRSPSPLVSPSSLSHEEHSDRHLQSSLPLDGLRILVVDDELDAREFMKTALEQAGATVVVAVSVEEVMQQWHAQSDVPLPDVLISDISMPVQDGYTLIRQIRALPPEQGGEIPAIALTAYAREEDRVQAIASGFHLHVAKPIDPTELVTVISALTGLG